MNESNDTLVRMREWCKTYLGDEGDTWIGIWKFNFISNRVSINKKWGDKPQFDIELWRDFYRFYFRKEADSVLFKLTWG